MNLFLRFKLIGESGLNVRFPVRIQIDGAGRLRVWNTHAGRPEIINLTEVELISIRQVTLAIRAA